MDRRSLYINPRERERALYPGQLAIWLRANPITRPRVNGELFELGQIIAHIDGDDSNFMTYPMTRFYEGESQESLKILLNDRRLGFLDRVETEISGLSLLGRHNKTRVVVNILRRLERVYEAIEKEHWTDLTSLEAGYLLWLPTKGYVSYQRDRDDKLRTAVQHFEDLNSHVLQAYEQYRTKRQD